MGIWRYGGADWRTRRHGTRRTAGQWGVDMGEPRGTHVPVLLERCLELLAPALDRPGRPRVHVDATLGLGGHAEAVLDGASRTSVLDRARPRHRGARARAGDRLAPLRRPDAPRARRLRRAARGARPSSASTAVDGVLFDLGVSSLQLDEAGPRLRLRPGRAAGHADGPDAGHHRRGGRQHATRRGELARVLRVYGEEKFATRIAVGDRPGAGARRRSPPRPGWPSWSGTRSRRPPGGPAGIRRSGRSRRCGSRSTASWPRWRRRCRRRWTRSPRAGGSWCCPTTRWRTGSSSGRSPRGPGHRRRSTCRSSCPAPGRRCGCSPAGAELPERGRGGGEPAGRVGAAAGGGTDRPRRGRTANGARRARHAPAARANGRASPEAANDEAGADVRIEATSTGGGRHERQQARTAVGGPDRGARSRRPARTASDSARRGSSRRRARRRCAA